jgi:hypothetical protein
VPHALRNGTGQRLPQATRDDRTNGLRDLIRQRATSNHLAQLLRRPAFKEHAGHSPTLILERRSRQQELRLLRTNRRQQVDARIPSDLMGDR